MPLTEKGQKIMRSMQAQYPSDKKAKEVFYASANKGTIGGVEKPKKKKPDKKVSRRGKNYTIRDRSRR